jgi:hypothetical protein
VSTVVMGGNELDGVSEPGLNWQWRSSGRLGTGQEAHEECQ